MSFISEKVGPFFEAFSRAIEGEYVTNELQYKGGKEAGMDFSSKIERASRRYIRDRYDSTLQALKEPTYINFLKDNVTRLLCNPFDRLIVAYQAYPFLKARFLKPATFSHTFTEIMNEGVIFGAFKGLIFNAAQLSLVTYPAVYLANTNNSDNKYMSFLTSFTILDAIFYPLDLLKTALYADTLGKFSIRSIAGHVHFTNLYAGLPVKLIYNLPVLSGYYCTTQVGMEKESLLAWLLAAITYPLNTLKVRLQLTKTSLTTSEATQSFVSHSSYRGVVPFVLLNAFIGYSLRPIFSAQKLQEIEADVMKEIFKKKLH